MNIIARENQEISKSLLDGGYCIGCGACAFSNPALDVSRNDFGLLEPQGDTSSINEQVCPFLSDKNEDDLALELYSAVKEIRHDKKIGYYDSLYAGHVTEGGCREKSSSGGMTTWILEQLMEQGEIDAVIHVGATDDNGNMFRYMISNSLSELKSNSKSRYYPTHFDSALEEVITSGVERKYAFVGIPCYIKAVRLLCLENERLSRQIKFFVGIFCGHMKSAAFSELLAWQQGVKPNKLNYIDFRVKGVSPKANNYGISVAEEHYSPPPAINNRLYGTDWGLGLFKPRSCEWCDDVSAETADVVCGDAWLPKYIADNGGDNIVIVRHPVISKVIAGGLEQGKLTMDSLSVDDVVRSQAGNYRHRQEGLSVRIADAAKRGIWQPNKRIRPSDYDLPEDREKLYLARMLLSEKSHKAFYSAKKAGSLWVFVLKMFPYELYYNYLNKRVVKGTARSLYCHAQTIKRLWLKR